MSNIVARDWKEFADITIRINDLDPTYEMLWKARKQYGDDWVERFCIHMLMFYHIGEAAIAANYEGQDFWNHVEANYTYTKRGSERRHFRGEAGRAAIRSLKQASGNATQGLLKAFYRPDYPTLYLGVKNGLEGFGEYFIWKWADYLDRIFDMPIDFSNAFPYMPEQPMKCARAMWPDQHPRDTLEMVREYISQYPAPPSGNRPCGIAEAETILCMLKGYFITKSHTIGDDIEDKYAALGQDPYGLAKFLPKLP